MDELRLPDEKELTYEFLMRSFEKMNSAQKNEMFSVVLRSQLYQEYTLRAMSLPEFLKKSL